MVSTVLLCCRSEKKNRMWMHMEKNHFSILKLIKKELSHIKKKTDTDLEK